MPGLWLCDADVNWSASSAMYADICSAVAAGQAAGRAGRPGEHLLGITSSPYRRSACRRAVAAYERCAVLRILEFSVRVSPWILAEDPRPHSAAICHFSVNMWQCHLWSAVPPPHIY